VIYKPIFAPFCLVLLLFASFCPLDLVWISRVVMVKPSFFLYAARWTACRQPPPASRAAPGCRAAGPQGRDDEGDKQQQHDPPDAGHPRTVADEGGDQAVHYYLNTISKEGVIKRTEATRPRRRQHDVKHAVRIGRCFAMLHSQLICVFVY
jgi:hypothetical protein